MIIKKLVLWVAGGVLVFGLYKIFWMIGARILSQEASSFYNISWGWFPAIIIASLIFYLFLKAPDPEEKK